MSQIDWEVVRRRLDEVADGGEEDDAEVLAVARRLTEHGSYPALQLVRQPSIATWLAESRWRFDPMPERELAEDLDAYLDAARLDDGGLTEAGVAAKLRAFRHRQLLRIFLREIEGASVRRTTAEVADVAQACLQAALREAARLEDMPHLAGQICIFGMGKLGGRELNFSSDVDVVFVVDDQCRDNTDDGAVDRIARRVVALMDEVTEDGRVFRVDLRLRPQGTQGRLVPAESGLVDYYLNWGETWERGVWLKARVVAGNCEMGERILEALEPFLFRRHLDFDVIDDLRRMKELIDHEAKASDFVNIENPPERDDEPSTSPFKARLLRKFNRSRGPTEPSTEQKAKKERPATGWDVKIGRGGIREIEFFVQALQLVHCGLRPELRVRTTLDALDRLLYSGLLSSAEHAKLTDAYDLFRRLEHRIQMEADRQSHRLPTEDEKFADLAHRMKMPAQSLRGEIELARDHVRSIFERLFSDSPRRSEKATVGEEREGTLERIIGLGAEQLLDESVIDTIRQAGFSRPRQVAGQLQVLRRKEHGPFSESPRSADPQVARYLLSSLRDAPDPEAALGHLLRFSTAVGDTPSTWSMLAENPHAARLLIHLFGSSPPLAGLLAEEPEVFERLIYGGSARVVRRPEELASALEQRLSGVGDRARRMGRIRRFHREEIVRIALHEVAGAVEVETTCRQLTDLAELVLKSLFREVVDEYCRANYESLTDADPVDDLELALVAMGKLGGREMGFGSDLDFFFVYHGSTSGGLEHTTATRLAKRLVRAMTATTAIGDLYEVDLRLRPSGTQGTLVVSVDAWEDYHRDRAQFWERQALVRARCVTGTPSLRQRIDEGRRRLTFEAPLPPDARSQIVDMRDRLRAQAQGAAQEFDVKFDEGGLVDVEFLIQWLQLSADAATSVWKKRSSFDVLRTLDGHRSRRHSGVELAGLLRDYSWLRRLECRLAISGAGPVVPKRGAARRALIRQMGHQGRDGEEQFDAELAAVRARNARAWDLVFGQRQ